MSQSKRYLLIAALVIVLVVIGGALFINPQYSNDTGDSSGAPAGTEDAGTQNEIEESLGGQRVRYTRSGFEPRNIDIQRGQTVTFVNEGGFPMWVASDLHPSHNIYPEFDHGRAVGSGESYSFTFTKTGDWNYHNHSRANHTGTVVVK